MLVPLFYVLRCILWPGSLRFGTRLGLFWVGLFLIVGRCTPLNFGQSIGVWCCSFAVMHGGARLLCSRHLSLDCDVASLIFGLCGFGAWLSGDLWTCAVLYGALASAFFGFSTISAAAPIRTSQARHPWHKLKADRRYHALRCRGLMLCILICSPLGGASHGVEQSRNSGMDQPEHWREEVGPKGTVLINPFVLAQDQYDEPLSLMQASANAREAGRSAIMIPRVPQMRSAQGLQPIEECGARPLLLQEVCLPAYHRRIAVFHGDLVEGSEPLIFQVDSRVFRPLLDAQIKQAVGLDAITADLLAIVSAFPDLPLEQYVLRPARLPWFLQNVPIRNVGTSVSFQVLQLARDDYCHDIIAAVARRLHLPVIPEAEMCTCAPGHFVADSQPLMHPQCDTITWQSGASPGDRVSHPATPSTARSMELEAGTSGGNSPRAHAAVITPNGLIHAELPAFRPDPDCIRILRAQFPELLTLHVRRLRFPLAGLPVTQFLAHDQSDVGMHTLVADLRDSDLGLLAVSVPRFTTCRTLVEAVTRVHARILDEEAILREVDAGGQACFLHDHAARPHVLLDLEPFDVFRLHVMSQGQDLPDERGVAPRRSTSRLPLLGALACPAQLRLWCLLTLVWDGPLLVHAARASSAPPHRADRRVRAPVPMMAFPSQASQATHAAIQSELLSAGRLLTPNLSPSLLGSEDPRIVTFKVWFPEGSFFRQYLVGLSWDDIRAGLLGVSLVRDRACLLPVMAPPDHTAVHLVATSCNILHSTILVRYHDVWTCLDVDWRNPANAIFEWGMARDGHQCVRIDCAHRGKLRHGDVCVLVPNYAALDPPLLDVSTHSLVMPRGCSWQQGSRQQVFPLIQPAQPHLWLPRMYGVSARETAANMLTRALPATADSLTLLDVPPQLMGLPGPILLASTRGAICTLVWLHDSHEGPQLGAAFAVTGIFPNRDDLLRALQCLPGEAATLWHQVEAAHLEWRYSQTISLADSNAVVAEVVVATANMRAALTVTGGESLSSETQPSQFRPGTQSVDGQLSSLSSGEHDPCVAAPGMQAPGTLRVVYCSGLQISCVVPCDARYIPWGLIVGDQIFTSCTPQVAWAEIATVAGVSVLALQGAAVSVEGVFWHWPDEPSGLRFACGLFIPGGLSVPTHTDCHTIIAPLHRPYSAPGHSADPHPAVSSCTCRPWVRMFYIGNLLSASLCSHRPLFLPVLLGILTAGMHSEAPPDQTEGQTRAGAAEASSMQLQERPLVRPRVQSLCVPSPAFLSMTDLVACLSDAAAVNTVVRIWRPCCGPAAIGLSHALTEAHVLDWLKAQGRTVFRIPLTLCVPRQLLGVGGLCASRAAGNTSDQSRCHRWEYLQRSNLMALLARLWLTTDILAIMPCRLEHELESVRVSQTCLVFSLAPG